MKDKKAFTKFELVLVFFKFVVLTAVLLTIVFLTNYFSQKSINIKEGEMNLFSDNIVYSKSGLSYYESATGRTYPGIIDLNEIKNMQSLEYKLNNAFDYGKYPLMAANIKFEVNENAKKELEGLDINNINIIYNREWYDKWIVLSGWGLGRQSVKSIDKTYYVLLKKDDKLDKLIPAKLHVNLLSPES